MGIVGDGYQGNPCSTYHSFDGTYVFDHGSVTVGTSTYNGPIVVHYKESLTNSNSWHEFADGSYASGTGCQTVAQGGVGPGVDWIPGFTMEITGKNSSGTELKCDDDDAEYRRGRNLALNVADPEHQNFRSNGADATCRINGGTGYTGSVASTQILFACTSPITPATCTTKGGSFSFDDSASGGGSPTTTTTVPPDPTSSELCIDPDQATGKDDSDSTPPPGNECGDEAAVDDSAQDHAYSTAWEIGERWPTAPLASVPIGGSDAAASLPQVVAAESSPIQEPDALGATSTTAPPEPFNPPPSGAVRVGERKCHYQMPTTKTYERSFCKEVWRVYGDDGSDEYDYFIWLGNSSGWATSGRKMHKMKVRIATKTPMAAEIVERNPNGPVDLLSGRTKNYTIGFAAQGFSVSKSVSANEVAGKIYPYTTDPDMYYVAWKASPGQYRGSGPENGVEIAGAVTWKVRQPAPGAVAKFPPMVSNAPVRTCRFC